MAGFGIYKLSSITGNSFKVVKKTNTKFEDIAGMDDLKKEMLKVVDILKNQKEYKEIFSCFSVTGTRSVHMK